MRILYLSRHEVLEYDEVRMFTRMGHEVYSLGRYDHPEAVGHLRPGIPGLPSRPALAAMGLTYGQEHLHPEMLEDIDLVLIMHDPELVIRNWGVLGSFLRGGGRVVWRSIGQMQPHQERSLSLSRADGLEMVRYSPAEATITDYLGADAVIRFAKDPTEWGGWKGSRLEVANFTQSMPKRADHTQQWVFEHIAENIAPLGRVKVYGPGNESLGGLHGGLLSLEAQHSTLRSARAYLYTGTYPASYTLNFIEAWMTGIPVVAVGPGRGNGPMYPGQRTYEIPDLIETGVTGFWSDSLPELVGICRELLRDFGLAERVGDAGRVRAVEVFGEPVISRQWEAFLTK